MLDASYMNSGVCSMWRQGAHAPSPVFNLYSLLEGNGVCAMVEYFQSALNG